ncbi:uncharacterized protein LOC128740081 [Sabethes cyaneus]|uniref:uncharacterized protein LOC128740081 n=1 Tax=Sabethes cyaneus TaxID=53552 RepID=UPI00237D5644|nr:uncharacterized protein LOC128740081 [Sabethes cyaneus]
MVCNEMAIPDEISENALPELKAAIAISDVRMNMPSFFSNYSNFHKLQRIVSYISRFADNCHKQNPADRELRSHLTVHELSRATETILHVIQHAHFADEIKRVLDNEPCKRLGNLRPIYTNGLLRVGGRLDRSQLPFESRHQIILPDKNPVIHRFIQQMHVELFHVGKTGLLNALRQRYWLPKGRSIIHFITRRRVKCFRTNPTTPNPLMGNLPASRVMLSPPFAITGVDYAGPFWIKQGSRRPTLIKAYVALFVCMATKPVHLEVVSDLSTDAFLASLRRLIARRGMIHELHSENATNFRGANHKLNSLYQQFQNQQAVNAIESF